MENTNTVIKNDADNGTNPTNDDNIPPVSNDSKTTSEPSEQSERQANERADKNSDDGDKTILVKESKSENNDKVASEGENASKVAEETDAADDIADNASKENVDIDAEKEFKVDLNFEKPGDSNPRYCRVNTVFQIREKFPKPEKTFNNSFPDLRKPSETPISVSHVTNAFLVANRSYHRVAAVVAQPRVKFITEDHGFETPVKQHAIMAENGDDVSSAGSTSAVVVTTAPGTIMDEGDGDEFIENPPLQRRISLNPRMMLPPGLDVLKNKAVVIVRQQMDADLMEGCGVPNTYMLMDINDEQLFFAGEASSCFCRWVCGPNRQFALELFSATDDFVLSLHRTCCRCDWCCCLDCFLCNQKLYVTDCLGRTLGAVKQKFSLLGAKFDILDHDNNVIFKIKGSCCVCRCNTDIYFKVMDKNGERQIGKIQKKWGGDRPDNVNVDHEYFDVSFPPRLDSVDKALILAAAFLVNYMYFEMS